MALGIEYDGTPFRGWQIQRAALTVQGTLEKALSQVADQPIQTTCSGRTDAGVHAVCQVVHFDVVVKRDLRAWVWGVNSLLPDSIRVLWAKEVPLDFHARYSAFRRHYRYLIYNYTLRPSLLRQYVGWYYRDLDVDRMRKGAANWIGEHDFSSFRSAECQSRTPIREVYSIDIERNREQVIIDLKANAFLHHMVRNMVGTLLPIGSGLREPQWAKSVLEAASRSSANITAPAQGLYLISAEYPKEFALPSVSGRIPGYID